MNFRNYIDIFTLNKKKPKKYREQLYASGNRLSYIFDELIQTMREKNNTTFSQIADYFNVSNKTLRVWRNGSSPIPLNILEKLSKDNLSIRELLETNIDYISSSRGIKIKIPREITPKLIEIFGRFCGDGSCGIYKDNYKWSLKEEGKNLIAINSNDMKEVFDINGEIFDYGTYSENIILSKPLVLLFQQIFNYSDTFHKTHDIKPPNFLKKLDWSIRKHFTTGIIDTEGSFYYTNQSYYFEVHMVNRFIIEEIANAFSYFNIPFNIKEQTKNDLHLISYGKSNYHFICDLFEIKNSKHLDKLRNWNII